MEFKVGDRVRRTGYNFGNLKVGDIRVVESIHLHSLRFKDDSHDYHESNFIPLLHDKKDDSGMKQQSGDYQFKTSSPHAINWAKIGEECTEQTPLLFVRVNDEYYSVIHRTIMNKAIVCNIPKDIKHSSGICHPYQDVVVCKMYQKDHSAYVNFVRDVQQASWPNGKTTIVQVHKAHL